MRTIAMFKSALLVCLLLVAVLLAGCSDALAGSTYKASEPNGDGEMTVTFVDGEQCKLAFGGAMGKLEFTTKYAVAGDKITIQSPMGDDDPLVLTRSGSTLEGEMDGDNLKFVKQ